MSVKLSIVRLFSILIFAIALTHTSLVSAKTNYMTLHVGSIKTLKIGDISRVAVGRDDILGTSALDNGELLLIPKAAGETDLQVWKPGEKKIVYRLKILETNSSSKKAVVKSLLSKYKNVTVKAVDNYILVDGVVEPTEFELFEKIVSSIPNVISAVEARSFTMEKMVKIKIQVLEIDKKYKKELGFKWGESLDGPVVAVASGIVTNGQYAVTPSNDGVEWSSALSGVSLSDPYFYPYVGFAGSLASRIQLIEENGAGRTLAEPTLVTRSGQDASFQSGGEFPFVYFDQGEPRVEFKDYGVLLNISPVVDENDNILVSISTEVSSIDFSTIVNGVPGLLTRNTDSVINVRDGDTIAISGLLSVFDSKSANKVPLLGDIPVIGKLFSSKATIQNRSELVILATPVIIKNTVNHGVTAGAMSNLDELSRTLKDGFDGGLLE